MDRNRIAYLIQKLRSRQATREEIDELEAFWHLANSDRTTFEALSEEDRNEIRIAMLRNIRERISGLAKGDLVVRRHFPVLSWTMAIAASVTLMIAAAIFLVGSDSEELIQTAYGEQSFFRLPDNSTVIINGNSSIRYHSQWNDNEDREVWIDGEAFFDVTHTANDQKFIVRTASGMVVRVLGTRFNVKVRRGKTEVMLEAGSVRLDVERDDMSESLMLVPGDLAVLSGERLEKTQVKAEQYTSWKESKLVFSQTPLSDIGALLEDTYGVTVVFEDSTLKSRKLSGEIAADNLADIVKAIEESMNIGIVQKETRIVFQHDKN